MSQPLQLEPLGGKDGLERDLYFLSLPDFASLPDSIFSPGLRFVAFVAADAKGIDAAVLADFSSKLTKAGCVYFCAWGLDCKRVHDVFDEGVLDVEPVIMTTWYDKESLDKALWFFLFSAFPDDGYGVVQNGLAISIDNPAWDKQIRNGLADVESFNKKMLQED
jgi:hypothetical protein